MLRGIWDAHGVEDIVTVRLVLETGESRYFMTWGRIQDEVDPTRLEELVLAACGRFAIAGNAVSAHLCASLQEARDEPYFFEALFSFSQRPIPFGEGYEVWRQSMDERMRNGKEIYFLGSR